MVKANSYGKPVIGGNSGGVPDAILNGKTGFLIDSDEELENKISQLLENRELRLKIGEVGRKRAIKEFNNNQSDYLQKLFRESIRHE